MVNTIAFFEREYDNKSVNERLNFQKFVKKNSFPLFHKWDSLSANTIPKILFFHGGDALHLKNNNKFKNELADTWLIEFGGNPTDQREPEGKFIAYIKYSDLQERLVDIKNAIEKFDVITAENITNIIFAIDPQLEKFLKPFTTHSPFEKALPKAKDDKGNIITDKNGKELTIKDVLSIHVQEYLSKQRKQ